MNTYHKIQTVFKRDPSTNFKTLLFGDYAKPEFEYLKNNQWVFTEKVDGTNIRIKWVDREVRFAGKTDRAKIPKPLFANLTEMFETRYERLLSVFDCDVCLYGEGYGAKIQSGGKYSQKRQMFVLFDVKIGEWWLNRIDVEDIAKKLGLDIVPVIGQGRLIRMAEMTQEGFRSQWGDFQAEGIVARPLTELKSRNGERIITKIKCKDFRSAK
jgi:hypothetical protein